MEQREKNIHVHDGVTETKFVNLQQAFAWFSVLVALLMFARAMGWVTN